MPMTERFFNTSGPVVPAKHYCVPPLERFDLDEILRLIRAERYFVLHAPRQTGKTSALLAVWRQTRGQPWLVNALAYQACFEDRAGRKRSRPITGGRSWRRRRS